MLLFSYFFPFYSFSKAHWRIVKSCLLNFSVRVIHSFWSFLFETFWVLTLILQLVVKGERNLRLEAEVQEALVNKENLKKRVQKLIFAPQRLPQASLQKTCSWTARAAWHFLSNSSAKGTSYAMTWGESWERQNACCVQYQKVEKVGTSLSFQDGQADNRQTSTQLKNQFLDTSLGMKCKGVAIDSCA